ncbi:hypothetical protein JW916_12325 [Candidatus Sumerlaeota bacterium]|nr:hypothetical protein [Candidatus Sumerlaeota bacterium]
MSLGVGFALKSLIVCGLFVLAIVFMWFVFRFLTRGDKRGKSATGGPSQDEQTQRMHTDLVRMEERIESLETILIEHSRKERG